MVMELLKKEWKHIASTTIGIVALVLIAKMYFDSQSSGKTNGVVTKSQLDSKIAVLQAECKKEDGVTKVDVRHINEGLGELKADVKEMKKKVDSLSEKIIELLAEIKRRNGG